MEIFISEMDDNSPLEQKIFLFLIKLMGCRDQLRMNHWQTTSYAEHKLTNEMTIFLSSLIDRIGENALGLFDRPKINTVTNNLSDIKVVSTSFIIEKLIEETKCIAEEFSVTSHESIKNLLAELEENIYKSKYLLSLN